jgi:DnaJ-domain-containing protein 1
MSILSRISRILRANLHVGSDTPQTDYSFYEDYLRKKRAEGNSQSQDRQQASSNEKDSQNRNGSSHQDLELAKYYANLEVPYGSDLETVRHAWKQLVRKYHPDFHSENPEKQEIANKLVQELNHAYKELEKRLTA